MSRNRRAGGQMPLSSLDILQDLQARLAKTLPLVPPDDPLQDKLVQLNDLFSAMTVGVPRVKVAPDRLHQV